MKSTPLAVIILAAGKGTRMKSDLPKVLHPLNGKPMVAQVLATVQKLSPARVVVITGYGADDVEAYISKSFKNVRFARQVEQLGTAHAVLQAKKLLGTFAGTVLVVYGDAPLVTPEALQTLISNHRQGGHTVTELTTTVSNPTGFGRILRDKKGAYVQTMEEKDATHAQRKITEVSTCLYSFTSPAIWPLLAKIDNNNAKAEYYLTRIMSVAAQAGRKVNALTIEGGLELLGINSPEELAAAEQRLTAPQSEGNTFISAEGLPDDLAKLIRSSKTPLEMLNALPAFLKKKLKGQTIHGTVEKGAVLHGDVYVGKGSTVHSGAVVEGPVYIAEDVTIRPHANIRHGTYLGKGCVIGHSADVKNTLAVKGCKIQDGTFSGDSVLGHNARVGSGVILANRKFNQSSIGVSFNGKKPVDSKRDFLGCFMGDDSRIGANAITSPGTVIGQHTWVGSGAVISGYVAPDQLVTVKQELEYKSKQRISLKAGKAITYDL
ncbi:MAG: NTP transferase domain-containing protein [Proteobacteria bacterium]|nr:NTP transferase domain-containing protein [Pseudomonadota bacterium]